MVGGGFRGRGADFMAPPGDGTNATSLVNGDDVFQQMLNLGGKTVSCIERTYLALAQ